MMEFSQIFKDLKEGLLIAPLSGTSNDSEDVIINGITGTDELEVLTLQQNGWIRVNYYNEFGQCVGETYDK